MKAEVLLRESSVASDFPVASEQEAQTSGPPRGVNAHPIGLLTL